MYMVYTHICYITYYNYMYIHVSHICYGTLTIRVHNLIQNLSVSMQNTSTNCIKLTRNCISTYTVHRLKPTAHQELETILSVLPAQT